MAKNNDKKAIGEISTEAKNNDREKALEVLEKAKEIQGKVVYLPKGVGRNFIPKNQE